MLAETGVALMQDGRKDADRRVHAGHEIGDGDADLLRATSW